MTDYAQHMYLWPHLSLLAAQGDEQGAQEVVRRLTPDQCARLLHDAITSQMLMLRDVKAAATWCENSRERWAENVREMGQDLPPTERLPLRPV